jgi:hypothetical protein
VAIARKKSADWLQVLLAEGSFDPIPTDLPEAEAVDPHLSNNQAESGLRGLTTSTYDSKPFTAGDTAKMSETTTTAGGIAGWLAALATGKK